MKPKTLALDVSRVDINLSGESVRFNMEPVDSHNENSIIYKLSRAPMVCECPDRPGVHDFVDASSTGWRIIDPESNWHEVVNCPYCGERLPPVETP